MPGERHGDEARELFVATPSDDRPAAAGTEMLWREFEHLSGLYQFYLELIVKSFFAYTAIVSTITTIVLANTRTTAAIDWALLPLVMLSVLLAGGAHQSLPMAEELRHTIDDLKGRLDIPLAPHVTILIAATSGLRLLYAISTALLLALLLTLRLS